MKLLKYSIFATTLAAAINAFAAPANAPLSGASEPALAATTWQLIEIQSMDDQVYKPIEGELHTLQFELDGQLLVQADCNRGTGSWQQDANSITFSPIATTRAMCKPGSLDSRFLQNLSFTRSFILQDGLLYLATMADGAILKFMPAAPLASTIAPSFDCEDVQTSVEVSICQESVLAALDLQLEELYQLAMQRLPAQDHILLEATQSDWLNGRNECWKESEVTQCVQSQYELRVSELQIKTGELSAPEATTFQCDSGQTLELYFYNEAAHPALVLNNPNREILLYLEISASGARYANEHTEFWERGNEATYTNFERTTKCRRL